MDKQEMIRSLLGLMAIESVAWEKVSQEHPYGEGPARALDYVLTLCEKLGIRTVNRDGRIAWAEIGEGEQIVGILGHLDIVPIGEGWQHDPHGEICGERLYGRGACDDKGPVMAALYAMKQLQDAGTKLKRRVRLIFGQCEESGGWPDMAWYREREQLPVFGFTPDAEFPAIYGEKRILQYILRMPLGESGLRDAAGGDAVNMVPAWARATVGTPAGPACFEAAGRAAHGSTPEKGENAISALMRKLADLGLECPFADFYNQRIGFDTRGEKMGCAFSDAESGRLSLNAGLLRVEDGFVTLGLDIRCPVTVPESAVRAALECACAPWGVTAACAENKAPVYMDRDGEVIRAMMEVYREKTGDLSEPLVIGGGTYARAMPGIVAFGPMRPGRERTEHQKDEYILLEDLFEAEEIYRLTIEKLANL